MQMWFAWQTVDRMVNAKRDSANVRLVGRALLAESLNARTIAMGTAFVFSRSLDILALVGVRRTTCRQHALSVNRRRNPPCDVIGIKN